MSGRIRIEAIGDMGRYSKVVYVKADGEEVDLSDVVQRVEFSTDVHEPNRATIHVVMARGEMAAEKIELIKLVSGPNVTDATVLASEYAEFAPPAAA